MLVEKRQGTGLEFMSFVGRDGNRYLVFRSLERLVPHHRRGGSQAGGAGVRRHGGRPREHPPHVGSFVGKGIRA